MTSMNPHDTPMVTATVVPMKAPNDHSSSAPREAAPSYIRDKPKKLTGNQVERLMQQGFTKGLCLSVNPMKEVFALRFWIIDNSGSMQKTDGHRIVDTLSSDTVHRVPCTRWEEIQECVSYHIKLAGLIEAPTRFRLLNDPGANVGPQQFSVGEYPDTTPHDMQEALGIMRRARPGGCTPLTSHILAIQQEVSRMAPELRRHGKKAVIVIATDGLPTDERGYGGHEHSREFVDALRLLEGLPVWVVVRLCTDEDEVVDFYNELDGQLELSLEVLDDFSGEAAEVTGEQPWLSYGLPLHRLREFGFHDRVFDMLDERPLTKTELRDFAALLFGEESFDGVPDPSTDWKGFVADIDRLVKQEKKTFDPLKKRPSSWISKRKLNSAYSTSSFGCNIL
eukprot:CAMPEP_0198114614 /NCGR_PEP_ID=MMETSP1442-20131203/5944_1 /TAXON_ID= /ORGANISM="Craspedostauros australis, Strain CCMP3328" /LENGTH=393 /DNA_ID=CAMNT_0043771965 /DNA_START=172 /DNA_END=1353 /DNA_ORIENTATION=-